MPTKTHEPTCAPRQRILLAEDDPELRVLIALTLRGAGFEVIEAPDGSALLEHLASAVEPQGMIAGLDLVLSDIRMPHFTALDVLVGAQRFIGKTPFVLITAFGDVLTHERALSLGATAVLDKPIRLDDLCRTICEILARQPARVVAERGQGELVGSGANRERSRVP